MMYSRNQITILIVVALLVIGTGVLWWKPTAQEPLSPVATNDAFNGEKYDLIRVESPRPNQVVTSPLIVTGQARGNWFFEASFPVVLTDWDGRIIAQGIATANPPAGGDWMTTNFVPFEATLTFTVDKNVYSDRGALILRKDNPSGLSENDDALEIPVRIGPFTKTQREADTGSTINLSNTGLTKIEPSFFASHASITELNLSNNSIGGALPSQIQKLQNLRVLNASHNLMTGVPAEIGQLNNLEILDLSYNKLTGLPNELGNLKNLKTLNLAGNAYSVQDLEGIRKSIPQATIITQ